jgi:hypothetical protein
VPLFFRNLVLNINYRKKNNGGISKVGEGFGGGNAGFFEREKSIFYCGFMYM